MNAQTQSTSGDHDPGTPVIIKTGSNGPPGSNTVEVIIDSKFIPFSQFLQELNVKAWRSRSMLKGRIVKVSIVSEMKPDEETQPYREQLASITIEYGPHQTLVLSESGNTADDDVVLEIRSAGDPFNIETPGPWNIAKAWFPPPTRVVFKGGNKVLLDREFTETEQPTLEIKFLKTTVG